jgi:hypothetical protein
MPKLSSAQPAAGNAVSVSGTDRCYELPVLKFAVAIPEAGSDG